LIINSIHSQNILFLDNNSLAQLRA